MFHNFVSGSVCLALLASLGVGPVFPSSCSTELSLLVKYVEKESPVFFDLKTKQTHLDSIVDDPLVDLKKNSFGVSSEGSLVVSEDASFEVSSEDPTVVSDVESDEDLHLAAGDVVPGLFDSTSVLVPVVDRHYDCGWTFARNVGLGEAYARLLLVDTAQAWLGYSEVSGSFKEIIDFYNSQESLPRGYAMQYDDQWCATYASAVALRAGMSDIIPPECSCPVQKVLFQEQDAWVDAGEYMPLPGDYIYYHWECETPDCSHWPDHVGIVVGTRENLILVIEGNYRKSVCYRIIESDDYRVRGYGVPKYEAFAEELFKIDPGLGTSSDYNAFVENFLVLDNGA